MKETVAEFYSQMLGRAQAVLQRRGGRITRARGIQDTTRTQPTESTERYSSGSDRSSVYMLWLCGLVFLGDF